MPISVSGSHGKRSHSRWNNWWSTTGRLSNRTNAMMYFRVQRAVCSKV